MSRGVVLWPDNRTSDAIRAFWDDLAAAGLPSLSTHTHRLHQPHLSLVVAEDLPVQDVLVGVGAVPSEPIELKVEAAGVFPQGALFLAPKPSAALLDEQARVEQVVRPLARQTWPFFASGDWMPHLTCAVGLMPNELQEALSIAARHLPILGWFDRGGVEDGTTGENWPSDRNTERKVPRNTYG